jgi:hypothetical protein
VGVLQVPLQEDKGCGTLKQLKNQLLFCPHLHGDFNKSICYSATKHYVEHLSYNGCSFVVKQRGWWT